MPPHIGHMLVDDDADAVGGVGHENIYETAYHRTAVNIYQRLGHWDAFLYQSAAFSGSYNCVIH